VFNRILVPLDGSLLAEGVIIHAAQFARIFGGRITLLQILDPAPYQEGQHAVEPLDWQILKAQAEMYLQAVAAQLERMGISTTYALREGNAPENIVSFAQSEGFELVVLNSHGASGLSRWNISSVVSKVLDKIYLPVLLVRAYHGATEAGGPAERGQTTEAASSSEYTANPGTSAARMTMSTAAHLPFLYRRILLPIDSSRRAECALPAATNLAMAQDGESTTVVIMGAVIAPPNLPLPMPYPEEVHQLIERFMQITRTAVENYLYEMRQRIPGACEIRIVEQNNVVAGLHDLAEKENADLVILCAHGQTGGTSYPYGSITRNYLEYGTKNVLVIQDVPLSQVRPSAAEVAAERYGKR